MKKISLILIFYSVSFLFNTCYAQNFEWATKFSSFGTDWGNAVELDQSENVYSVGSFQGTIDFNPGPGINNVSCSGAGQSVYISKLDNNGNFVWAKAFGGGASGYGIDFDNSGNVYTTGRFAFTDDFDPGVGVSDTFTLNNAVNAMGSEDIFVSKLDSNGNFLWAKAMGGAGIDRGTDLIVDDTGNVYVTGYFSGTVDFDPGIGFYNLTSSGAEDIFIVKLSSVGNFLWAKKIGAGYPDVSNAIVLDNSGNIYLSGGFCSTVDFDPGIGTHNLVATVAPGNPANIFLLKLDNVGNFVWAQGIGSIGNDMANGICLDHNGFVYITGYYKQTVDFDPGAGVVNYTSAGDYDAFISKYTLGGSFVWAKTFGGSSTEYGQGIATDAGSNIYSTGVYGGVADFDPGIGIFNLSSSSFGIFVNRLDSNGNFIWAIGITGSGGGQGEEVSIDNSGDVFVAGQLSGEADFDPGVGVYNLNGLNPPEAFICKFSQDLCSSMSLTIDSVVDGSCASPLAFASANLINGNPPYQYSWNTSPVQTTQDANFPIGGIYQLIVTDTFGCTRTTSVFTNAPTYSTVDLNPHMVVDIFRPGFPANIWLDGFNDGCSPVSGQMKLVLDSLVIFDSSTPMPDQISGDTLIWNFSDLTFDSLHVTPDIDVHTLASALIGDTAHFDLIMIPLTGDMDTVNNFKHYGFPFRNGYDPNDKKVYPQGECAAGYILNNESLTYTIRFQNTGNSNAVNIHILDTIDVNFDPSTYRTISSSHNLITEILPGNVLKFNFDNIQLPDSTSDEPHSHGYVIFEIMPDVGVSNGTGVNNTAHIYFDFNPAIITNTVTNVLVNSIPNSNYTITQSSCDDITINGYNYTTSGVYYQHLDNYLGCDSLLTLQLSFFDSTSASMNVTGCNNYTLNGITYDSSGTYTQLLSNSHGCDSILTLQLTIFDSASNSLNVTNCFNYTFNGVTYYSSGTYVQTLSNSHGCDSIVTLNLSINDVDVSVTQSGTQLFANTTGAVYQWLDCNTGLPVTGGTTQIYTSTSNGSYSVIVTQNGCTDTSNCFIVSGLYIESNNFYDIQVYPNPAKEFVSISTNHFEGSLKIELINCLGQTLETKYLTNSNTTNFQIDEAPGLYLLRFSDINGNVFIQKVIKDI